jgi:demethylmenaquinone methyltransferase/2-methoxy-6-polyprenyl-1,4-benzoquinol methylase
MPETEKHGAADGGPEVDFGYRRVPAAEKDALVRGVFETVAHRYDAMNDLMSWGVHRLWKAALVDALAPRPGMRVLDLAGGTGDVAGRIAERVRRAGGTPDIVVCDLTPAMIEAGRDRAIDMGRLDGIAWTCGDAQALPFADRSMDACTIAFGLRNVSLIDRALGEIRRVLKPGGRFLCLEFSRVVVPVLGPLYDRYSFSVLPALGRMVAGDEDAYRYLAESIRRFPDQETLAQRMGEAGLARASWRNLSGGIAALHSGWRI